MKKTIIIASHNANKIREFRLLFKDTPYTILSLADINYLDDIIEDGATFQDNALIKAKTIYAKTNIPVIADDSGLIVNALGDFPGVQSARFMAEHTYSEKNAAINEMLQNHSDKSAKFVCAIALVGLEHFPQVFMGVAKGVIINEERGSNGFGYDPIFFYPDFQKTFAELTAEEKDAVSHRGIATRNLLTYLHEHHF